MEIYDPNESEGASYVQGEGSSRKTRLSSVDAFNEDAQAQEEIPNKQVAISTLVSLLIFLGMLAVLGASLYISIVAIPFITAGLTAALGLTFGAPWMITLIAMLPVIASIAAFLKWMGVYWQVSQMAVEITRQRERQRSGVASTLNLRLIHKGLLLIFPQMICVMGLIAIFFDAHFRDVQREAKRYFFMGLPAELDIGKLNPINKEEALFSELLSIYQILASLAALGLGIFLAVKLGPLFLGIMVASWGVPYGIAILGIIGMGVGLIMITRALINLPVKLGEIWLDRHFLSSWEGKNPEYVAERFRLSAAIVGIGLGIAVSYVVFPSLVTALTIALAPSMAVFTAVAVCLAITLLFMRWLPKLCVELPVWVNDRRVGKVEENYFDKFPLKRGVQKDNLGVDLRPNSSKQRTSSYDLGQEGRAGHVPLTRLEQINDGHPAPRTSLAYTFYLLKASERRERAFKHRLL